jgi:hypothetical protein
LEYALEKQIPHGFWGGSTPADRDSVVIAKNKSYAFKGIALSIIQLHKKGISANEIAAQLDTSPGYAKRVLKKLVATEQGAEPLHQQIKGSSKGLH